jgi:hypothetical protein
LRQSRQRRNSPRGDHIRTVGITRVLGSAADDADPLQTQGSDGFLQENDPAFQRLEQFQVEVRARQGEWDAGQTRAGSDIGHSRSGLDQLGGYRTVQQVSIPEPGHLARPQQAADHPVGRQQPRVLASYRQPIPEDSERGWRRFRQCRRPYCRFGCFT